MQSVLTIERTGPVAVLTLNRPEVRNALTLGMYDALGEAVRGLTEAPGVRVAVLTGAGGRAFAAGTDIAEFRDIRTKADALAYEARVERTLSAIAALPIPTVAALAGACTGGGAAISAACDIRLADAGLAWGFPIARTLGNCLSTANLARLVGLIGRARVTELLLTARLIGAEEARAIGLVAEVLPNAEALAARALDLAHAMAALSPITHASTKEALRRLAAASPQADGSDLVAAAYTSADFQNAIEAFLAKRPPVWTGR